MQITPEDAALNKAKIALMSRADSAFFTTLAFNLKHSFSSTQTKTAGTNGKQVIYNPEFFMGLSHDERIFLMLHEAMHCAYLHMERQQTRDKRKFNRAADHAINLQLLERGFKMPSMGLADSQYKGMSAEEIYNVLPEEKNKDEPMEGFGEDLMESDVPHEQLQSDMQDILVQAALQSKMANDTPGSIPGDIQIFLDRLLAPKLPWNKILLKYLRTFAKNDYSFRKPNRRFFPTYYLPSLFGENLMNLAIAVDTSGSVSDTDFNRFVSETHSILRMMKPDKLTMIQFDTEIKLVSEVKNVKDLMNINFSGRGGTHIDPLLNWANENKPQLLLVFTDGGFNFSDVTFAGETLWLIHENPEWQAPFGKTIHYEV